MSTLITAGRVASGVLSPSIPSLTPDEAFPLQLDAAGGLLLVGSRQIAISGTIVNSASYSAEYSIGGLIAIPLGLPAGLLVTPTVFLRTYGVVDGNTALLYLWFNSNVAVLGSSTIVDGEELSIAASDFPSLVYGTAAAQGVSQGIGGGGAATLAGWSFSSSVKIPVDASGNIYLAIAPSSAGSMSGLTPASLSYLGNVAY